MYVKMEMKSISRVTEDKAGARERYVHPIGISCWQNGRQKQQTGLMQRINDISFPPLMPFVSLAATLVKYLSLLPQSRK